MKFYKDPFILKLIACLITTKFLFLLYICFFNPLGQTVFTFPDTWGYLYPAQTLWANGTLLDAHIPQPMTLRTPGYPLFLLVFHVLPGSHLGAICMQILLSSFLPGAVYQITGLFAPRRTARLAAVLCAASVLYFVYSFALLSEILCAFLLAWFVYFALEYIFQNRLRALICASLLLAAAVTVRPVVYTFAGMCALVLAGWLLIQKTGFIKPLAAFLLPLFIIVGGWQLRNYMQTGWGGFTSFSAFQTYIWNADAYAAAHGITNQEADHILRTRRPDNFYNWPLARQQHWLSQQGRSLTLKSLPYKLPRIPLWAAKTLLGNNFTFSTQLLLGRPAPGAQTDSRLFNDTLSASGQLKLLPDILVFMITLLQSVGLALLAMAGIVWSWRKIPARAWWFLVFYMGSFWAAGASFFGAQSRYRAPFEFVLYIFGAIALEQLCTRFWQRQTKRTDTHQAS